MCHPGHECHEDGPIASLNDLLYGNVSLPQELEDIDHQGLASDSLLELVVKESLDSVYLFTELPSSVCLRFLSFLDEDADHGLCRMPEVCKANKCPDAK